jgi:hypothetical protein
VSSLQQDHIPRGRRFHIAASFFVWKRSVDPGLGTYGGQAQRRDLLTAWRSTLGQQCTRFFIAAMARWRTGKRMSFTGRFQRLSGDVGT